MFYIFLQFYLTSLRGTEYFAKEPEPEPGVFDPLGKKIRSRSRLKKKSGAGAGAGAAKKFAGSPALVWAIYLAIHSFIQRSLLLFK